MQTRGRTKPIPQCTSCGGSFSWLTSGAQPAQLFPLVCGDILCRVCLAQRARATLSSQEVPLECCKCVVPFDYIREVMVHAEHAYYSFLVNRASGIRTSAVNGNTDARFHAPPAPFVPADEELKAPAAGAQAPGYSVLARLRSTTAKYLSLSPTNIAAAPDATTQVQCQTCRSPCRQPLKAPCEHYLCRVCVLTEVSTALYNDIVPTSCCGMDLPMGMVQHVASGRDLTRYAKILARSNTNKGSSTTPTTKCGGKREAPAVAEVAPRARKARRLQAPNSALVLRSTTAKQNKAKDEPSQVDDKRECSSCFESVKRTAQWFVGPCGHGYCRSCVATMANLSLENRQRVPIRCCSTEFPVDYVRKVLTKTKFAQYDRFLREMDPNTSTLKSDREYAEMVRKQKGKQCPTCGIGVLKISGCQTMRCSNNHVFCFGCGQKNCVCYRNKSLLLNNNYHPHG